MTTKISGDNLQANIAIDTTGDQVFNGTLKLDGNFPTGTNNVALGNTALDNGSLTGSQNVAIGSSTLTDTDTGADNTAVGFEALKVVTTGTNNTAIGSGAGSTITSGSNLTLVGYNATPSAIDATNEITLGDANVTDVRIPGPGIYVDSTGLGIGTASPSTKLDVSGTANVSGNVTFGADLTVDTNTLFVDASENKIAIGTTDVGTDADTKLNIFHADSPTLLFERSSGNNNGAIRVSSGGLISFLNGADTRSVDALSERMRVAENGDISFYEDTGTTPKLFWDASEERLGIGTSSPQKTLHVADDGPTNAKHVVLRVENLDTGDSPVGLEFISNRGSSAGSTKIYGQPEDGSGTASIQYIGANHYFRNQGDTDGYMTINSSGNVGIGESSPLGTLHIKTTDVSLSPSTNADELVIEGTGNVGITIGANGGGTSNIFFGDTGDNNVGEIQYAHSTDHLAFNVNAGERMRIISDGTFLVNKTASNQGTVGLQVGGTGANVITQANGDAFRVNRTSSDGNVLLIMQDTSIEGTISVSGATVSYNGFTGTHWSRLSDNSKPTILKGTILESLDEMMDWYQVQFDITETDDEGNETTRTEKQSYALGDGESVGDVITYNFNTRKQDDDDNDIIEEVQATIIQEDDVKHVKCKVSDTANSKRVYGVFVSWDNDDDTVNDMYVAQVGTYVIRVHSSATVEAGDMLVSNGDGTAVTLSEDTPWTVGVAKTIIGKVLSTTKIETYEDGSYTVPCSLSC